MRKTLILLLALWTGTSNFAYASARTECASRMNQHACSSAMPCQCSIEVPFNDQTAPTDGKIILEPLRSVILPVDISEVAKPTHFLFEKISFESPPQQPPLYELFSVYRL